MHRRVSGCARALGMLSDELWAREFAECNYALSAGYVSGSRFSGTFVRAKGGKMNKEYAYPPAPTEYGMPVEDDFEPDSLPGHYGPFE